MTDRINSITVVLESDLRDDDAEDILSAIKQLRGVLSVTGNVAELDDHIAQQRVRHELGQKLWSVIYPPA
jgi:hypothetical protein